MLSTARQTRRAYTGADYRHIRQHYTSGASTAPQVARELGRKVGSLKFFISSHPELRKRAQV
ncbi:hypothetical protein LJ737_19805 [Hymenobacter sp. 15J16-1T3B]|uniref:hypothetical protein n=1 Tax=Hymenobacter sp. 15J16-1T3B TaxID=2886941 RepID=UPI001D125945|nr:hypothetical protein [Hymenobacter sp. 15J16-1T3B]MCC3159497.1 hypothetical protein [Hymenobacter sp. 15J16-1T3B]